MKIVKKFRLSRFIKKTKQQKDIDLEKEYEKIWMMFQTGKIKESLEEIDKLFEIEGLSKQFHLKCQILKGLILTFLGRIEESLELTEKSLKESRKMGFKEQIVQSIIVKTNVLFLFTDRTQEAFDILPEAKEIFKTLTDLDQKSFDWLDVPLTAYDALISYYDGDLKKSSEGYKKAYSIAKKHGWKFNAKMVLNNVMVNYMVQGEYNLAHNICKELIELCEDIGDESSLDAAKNYMVSIAHIQGNYKEALELSEELFKKYEKQEPLGDISSSLFHLVSLTIEMGLLEKTKYYIQRFEQINNQSSDRIINQRFELSKALFLKESSKLLDKAEAMKILKDLIYNDKIIIDPIPGILRITMLNLCDLLLEELKVYGNEEVLEEIKLLVKKLFEIAEKQNSHSLIVETYILESKLALIELDTTKAQRLLDQARILAEEKGMRTLAIKVSNEHDDLIAQIEKLGEMITKDTSLMERLEFTKLDETLSKMIKRKIEDVQEIPEEPVLLIILSNFGLTLFSHNFLKKIQVDEQLIGGFISAINVFCKETFHTTESLERIKHKEYTIIIKELKELIFSYVFKGKSFLALEKLSQFIDEIASDTKYDILKEQVATGLIAEKMDEFVELVNSIF